MNDRKLPRVLVRCPKCGREGAIKRKAYDIGRMITCTGCHAKTAPARLAENYVEHHRNQESKA